MKLTCSYCDRDIKVGEIYYYTYIFGNECRDCERKRTKQAKLGDFE